MPAGQPGACAVWLATAAIAAELCVSANLLTWAGVPYVTDGGALPLKLHPGTSLLVAATAAALAQGGTAWLQRAGTQLWLFTAAVAGCLISLALLSGTSNLIVLLDTFLPAGLAAAVLGSASDAARQRLRSMMQLLLALNAALALAEMAAQATLVPLYLNGNAYHPLTADFRPTALFDHPLTGALMTMIGLALAPRGRLAGIAYRCLLGAALLAFGGRTALAVTLATAAVLGFRRGARLVLSRHRRAGWAMLAAAGAALVGVGLGAAALAAGLGDRLAGHLYWDASAQVRLAQWEILGQLDTAQLLFGTPREALLADLNALRLATGVEVIENFWLLMAVSLGAIGFPLFLAGLGALCAWCWQRTDLQGRALLIGTLLVASSSNSLGRKSTVLVCLVAALVCLPRRRAAGRLPALPLAAQAQPA